MKLNQKTHDCLLKFGRIESIETIRKSIHNTSSVYKIRYSDSKILVLKQFETSESLGKVLFQRELIVYNDLINNNNLVPECVAQGEDFILLTYCEDDSSLVLNMIDIFSSLALFHNSINSKNHNNYYSFNFFGDINSWVDVFLGDLDNNAISMLPYNSREILHSSLSFISSLDHKNICHSDFCRNNMRILNGKVMIIDFECVSNLPLEFDLIFIFSFEAYINNKIPANVHEFVTEYFKLLNFKYEFQYDRLFNAIIFDSIRKYRFSNKNNLFETASYYFKRLVLLVNLFNKNQNKEFCCLLLSQELISN